MTGRAQRERHQRRIAITGRFVISQLYSTRTRDAKLFVRYLSIVAQSGRTGLLPLQTFGFLRQSGPKEKIGRSIPLAGRHAPDYVADIISHQHRAVLAERHPDRPSIGHRLVRCEEP
jgi:hypothetical protein